MRFPRHAALILCAVLCCLSAGQAAARELQVVGTYFPRIYEQAEDGRFTGLGPVVLEALAGSLRSKLRFELHPWARAQYMVEQGEADILVGPYRTSEREQRFAFAAEPFYQDRILFYARNDRAQPWAGDYDDLIGLRVAVVRGWVYGTRFEAVRERLQPIPVENVENGLRMLMAGRIDLLASNQRNTVPRLAALNLQASVRELEPLIDIQRGYFAFPRDAAHVELRQQFDEAFQHLIESGTLQRLAAPLEVSVPLLSSPAIPASESAQPVSSPPGPAPVAVDPAGSGG